MFNIKFWFYVLNQYYHGRVLKLLCRRYQYSMWCLLQSSQSMGRQWGSKKSGPMEWTEEFEEPSTLLLQASDETFEATFVVDRQDENDCARRLLAAQSLAEERRKGVPTTCSVRADRHTTWCVPSRPTVSLHNKSFFGCL
jgi:hypothetical protein